MRKQGSEFYAKAISPVTNPWTDITLWVYFLEMLLAGYIFGACLQELKEGYQRRDTWFLCTALFSFGWIIHIGGMWIVRLWRYIDEEKHKAMLDSWIWPIREVFILVAFAGMVVLIHKARKQLKSTAG